jgi:hypothetical protein
MERANACVIEATNQIKKRAGRAKAARGGASGE